MQSFGKKITEESEGKDVSNFGPKKSEEGIWLQRTDSPSPPQK
jgi:hypothetical protein